MKRDSLLLRCLRQRNFVIGLLLTGIVIACALVSYVWTPYSPTRINVIKWVVPGYPKVTMLGQPATLSACKRSDS